MSEGIRRRPLDPPGPMGPADAARDARIRHKLDRGEPLSPDEAALLADLPGAREIPPGVVRETARRAGGAEPVDAATGEAHDAGQ